MASNTISPAGGQIWGCRLHASNVVFLWCCQTWMQPSSRCKQNWGSFENTTSRHYSNQICRWTHYWMRSFYDTVSSVAEAMVASPCCWKRRHIVRADACCFANDIISWNRARDVVVRIIKTIRVRCMSSRLLVIMSRWNLARRFVWSY